MHPAPTPGRSRRRSRFPRAVPAAVVAAALLGGALVANPASAVAGAAFTTDASGQRVNQNQYAEKCDVYLNGGPNTNANDLSPGQYFFTVLTPGGQNDPNDGAPGVLYDEDDPYTDRTFTVAGGAITSYSGPHASGPDGSTGSETDRLIQLCLDSSDPSANFADTSNPGGVYILAVCALPDGGLAPGQRVAPRDCKYDAFKVRGASTPPTADLVAIKDARTSYTRTYAWDVDKSVDTPLVSRLSGSVDVTYTVRATKELVGDSAFAVTGEVTVFNPNAAAVSGVEVSDSTLDAPCVVSGGSSTIAGGGSATFTYTCGVGTATPTTGATNTATVTWDRTSIGSPSGSTTASAPYDFADAVVTTVGGTTDVTDRFDGASTPVVLAQGLTETTTLPTYTKQIPVPASNCRTYVNEAVVTQSSRSDTAEVRACGPNSDGFTIGFWKNNSSKVITSSTVTAYCGAIDAYRGIYGAPRSCASAKDLNSWISKTMSDGESSGDGVPMLKAQALATVLNVHPAPALGATGILLTAPERGALGLVDSCVPVTRTLDATLAAYGTLVTDKSKVVLVKDVLDRINNNRQLTC